MYPVLIEAGSDDLPGVAIKGEVWRVADDCLAMLDQVEGVPFGMFERKAIELAEHHGPVEAYIWAGDVEGMDDCGDWW